MKITVVYHSCPLVWQSLKQNLTKCICINTNKHKYFSFSLLVLISTHRGICDVCLFVQLISFHMSSSHIDFTTSGRILFFFYSQVIFHWIFPSFSLLIHLMMVMMIDSKFWLLLTVDAINIVFEASLWEVIFMPLNMYT